MKEWEVRLLMTTCGLSEGARKGSWGKKSHHLEIISEHSCKLKAEPQPSLEPVGTYAKFRGFPFFSGAFMP